MTIKTEIEELEKNQVILRVEVDADEIKKAIEQAFREAGREVSIPGFRRGKVPRRVLQARIGLEPIYEQVMEAKMGDYYRQAIEQAGIEPVAEPEIEDVEIEEGKPMTFKATVDVKPPVELTGYKGVEIEKPESEVTEEDINTALDRLRDRFAHLESAEGKKLADGDFALIDFTGTVNGKPLEDGSTDDFMFEVGKGMLWPEFDEEMTGKRVGDILDVKVKLPEDLAEEDMAGQTASFKVIVKEVKVKKLPELDDDFARESSEFDTLEELSGDLRAKMAKSKEEQAESQIQASVMEKLVDGLEVELSDKMIANYVRRNKERLQHDLENLGLSLDSYLGMSGTTEEKMDEELTENAIRRIKSEFILEEIIRQEELEVEDEALAEAIMDRAANSGVSVERFREMLDEQEAVEYFKQTILFQQAMKVLRDNAVLTEGTGSAS